MDEKSIAKGRKRSGKDRRKGDTSPYNGPERRTLRHRRSGRDRRHKKA